MIRIRSSGAGEIRLGGNLERGISSAIRRSLTAVKKEIGIKIKHRYTIAAGAVTRTITIKSSGMSGELRSSGGKNPLERFKIKPRRRLKKPPAGGVFAENVRGEGGYIRRGFLQKNGGVYERLSKARFPLKKFSGPSAPGMLSSTPVSTFVIAKLEEKLAKNLQQVLGAAI